VRTRPIVLALVGAALARAAPAHADADPGPWLVDVSLTGTASVPAGDAGDAGDAGAMGRGGGVPAIGVRIAHRAGPGYLGVVVGAGAPAYYGQHQLGVALGVDRELRGRRDGGARVVAGLGLELGGAFTFIAAPPETSADSDAVIYWSRYVRARASAAWLWLTPSGKELGLVVAAGFAAARASYTTTANGVDRRYEPSVEIGLALRM
jgi:hypothetical protein